MAFHTWDTNVSHASPRPYPVAAVVTLMVWNENEMYLNEPEAAWGLWCNQYLHDSYE